MALKKLKKLYKTNTKKSSKNTGSDIPKQVSNLKTRLEASGQSTDSRNWLQKALNLEEGTGFLGGLGDVLDRVSGTASVKAMLAGDINKSALENAWEGLIGKQRYTGVDVLGTINPDFKNASGVSKFAGGLATEILLDPTTYLTLGASAIAKGATKAGAKAIGTVDNVADLTKALKSTKTIDDASKLTKSASGAQDLLKASKAYRTADTIDTIANPLKLVPAGVKKAGKTGMKAISKVSPNTAEAITDLGKQFKKTFNYKGFLKQHLGKSSYDKLRNAEDLANASLEVVSSGSAKIQNKLDDMFKIVKKDPDRVWQITSKVDGSVSDFTFKGMTDDEIMKKLNEFAVNQVYFDRPTVINEETIRSLVTNKGRLMLPVQDFKNADDLEILEELLKDMVDDPDLVTISPYVQAGTGKTTGFVIDIGQDNVEGFASQLKNITGDIAKQEEIVLKRQAQLEKPALKMEKLQNKVDKANKELSKIEEALADTSVKRTQKQLDNLYTKRNKIAQTLALDEANMARVRDTSLAKALSRTEQASAQLDLLKNTQANLDELFKTRELIPYDSPIINIEGMEDVARIQRQTIDMNLGVRNLAGMKTEFIDKYDPYIHRKLTDESRAYLLTNKAKTDPAVQFIIASTDHLPSQSLASSVYGNFSPTEVSTMLGRDLFDSNIVASNLEMVKQLNRRNYNTELTKLLFSGDNDFIIDAKRLDPMVNLDLRNKGYVPVKATEVAKKLKLSELLGEAEINKITKALKGKEFLVNPDAIELFDKNAKLYKQLDSAFNQQLTKFMKYWKGGNLLSVGYHLRNIFGAQANMALAGMSLDDIAKYVSRAGLDMNKYNTKLLPKFREWVTNPVNAQIFKTGTADDLIRAFSKEVGDADARLFVDVLQAHNNGIIGGIVGQHDAVKRAIGEMPKSKLGRVADKIQDVNYKLGSTADDINRLASYRWAQNPDNMAKVAKVGAQNAKDFVSYAMFDFKAMSPTEQAYFTKLFPFYNFIKNNLSFQFSNMTRNSQNYKTLARAYNNLYDAQELTDNDVQQYVKDQLYIPIRQADGTIRVLKIAPPVQDATNLLQLKNLLGASNPLIQYITDRAYGEDLYTGKQLTSDRTQNVQELTDLIPYGRVARTLVSDPLSALLPVSTTSVEKANNQNAYAELLRLQELQKQYKQRTGQSLPTLEDLGLSK